MDDLLFTIWFFYPAIIANMSPIFANNIAVLEKFTQPIDMGKKYRGKRLLGDNKTYRGLASGVVSGFLVAVIQMLLYHNFSWIQSISGSIVDYSSPKVLLIGTILGLGALLGDSIKSFFKRQIGIASGRGWFPFDQTDSIFGAILFIAPIVTLPTKFYIIALIVALVAHPIINIIGWLLKLKPRPF